MSIFDGVFRCSALGVDDCVVWWDALAVVVSLLSVFATLFVGLMTLRLGRSAQEIAVSAVNLEEAAQKRDHHHHQREVRVLASLLLPEISETAAQFKWLVELIPAVVEKHGSISEVLRADLVAHVTGLRMPMATDALPRLAILPTDVSDPVTQAIGHVRGARDAMQLLASRKHHDEDKWLVDKVVSHCRGAAEHLESAEFSVERILMRAIDVECE